LSEHVSYLDLAGGAVRIDSPWAGILAQARERMVLCPDPPGETRGRIELIPAHAVQGIPGVRGLERGVCGFREQALDGRQRIVLRMFDRFNFVLLAEPGRVAVHMPPDAPASRVLDDVLPLALVPLLEERGGLMLHGAAVARRGRAAALLGVSGSGKSSTAFNLLRFGFRCCADDWVPVVPGEGGALGIRPVTRSLSLRPLSFSLLRDHGVSLETVRQVEDRYYGPAHRPGAGAGQGVLCLLCFVEAHGEPETVPERITAREARRLLEEEKRHFPLSWSCSPRGASERAASRRRPSRPGRPRRAAGTRQASSDAPSALRAGSRWASSSRCSRTRTSRCSPWPTASSRTSPRPGFFLWQRRRFPVRGRRRSGRAG